MNKYYCRLIFSLLSKLTFPRLLNIIKLKISYLITYFSGRYVRWGEPWTASIEPSALCNLQCPECPIGSHILTRPSNFINTDDFTRWIDQMQPQLFYLILYFQGEPLLHPNFPELIKIAHQRRIHTLTSTNAQTITEPLARKLVEAGLDEIIVSVDGTTEETYRQYRRGGTLEKATRGIENLVKVRKVLGKKNPFIRLQFIVMRHNEHQIQEIKLLGKKLGVDRVELKTAQIYDPTDPNKILPSNPKFARYKVNSQGLLEIKKKRHKGCMKMWEGTVLTWDGKVLPCCYDKDADHAFGQATATQTVKNILNNPMARTFRLKVMQSRSHYDMCKNCHER
ncbi:MAG: hypothetical protein PWP35_1296 [Bacteroidales bacterium]|nr:hypothetical protein [Bacteroidales bacterium]